MKNKKTIWGRTLIGMMLFVASPAVAQQPPPAPLAGAAPAPVDAQKVEALRLLKEGVDAAKAEDWALARKVLTQSVELDPAPFTIMQLGRAELMLGDAAQAAEHFEFYLLENSLLDEKHRDAQIEDAVRELFEEAKAKIATVRLTVNPTGAEVYIDDKRLEDRRLSSRVYLPPGPHKFEARKSGFDLAVKQSDLVAGTQVDLALKLIPQPEAQTVQHGATRIDKRWIKANAGVAGGLALLGIGSVIGANLVDPKSNEPQSLSDDDYNNREVMKGGFTYASIASFVGAAAVGGMTLAYVFTRTNQSPDAKFAPKAAVRIAPALGGVVVQGSWF